MSVAAHPADARTSFASTDGVPNGSELRRFGITCIRA
jgi:hypothetical protein